MRQIARFLARLYPRQWRDRYGREFDALLEDTPLRGADIFDLVKGALRMQFQFPNVWVRLGVFAVAGALAGVAAAYAVKPDYVATANIQFFFNSPDAMNAHMQQLLSRRSLTNIIVGENLFAQERLRLPMEDIIEIARQGVRVRSDGLFQVRASDPIAARILAEKLTYTAIAGQPVPVRPFLQWYAATGFGIGLVAFAANALFKMLARKTPPAVVS